MDKKILYCFGHNIFLEFNIKDLILHLKPKKPNNRCVIGIFKKTSYIDDDIKRFFNLYKKIEKKSAEFETPKDF